MPEDGPIDVYRDEETKADREITPLAQAQMREGELVVQLRQAVNNLSKRLRPVLSESANKVDGDRAIGDESAKRLRLGSSPTISMIEQQCENLEATISIVKGLTRNLEV